MKTLTVYTEREAAAFPLPFPEKLNQSAFMKQYALLAESRPDVTRLNGRELKSGQLTEITETIKAGISDGEVSKYSTIAVDPLRIGAGYDDHIKTEKGMLAIYRDEISVLDDTGLYIGGEKAGLGKHPLKYGNCIDIGALKITPHKDYVEITGACDVSLAPAALVPDRPAEYPLYKRSPRLIKREPSAGIELKAPAPKEEIKKGELLKLVIPPLAMVAVTVGVGMLIGRGIMMLMMVSMTLTSTVFSVTSHLKDRKERKIKEEKRVKDYEEYLLEQEKKLYDLEREQIESLNYHNLTPEKIMDAIADYSDRLYERAASDSDFVTLSLGLTAVSASYTVKCAEDGAKSGDNPLDAERQKIAGSYRNIKNMPAVIDLKKAHLGLVGEKHDTNRLLNHLLLQLCFYHSYHDIEIMIFTGEEERGAFEWARWLPHLKIKSINMSGLVSGENERDQVLGNIAQILKARQQKQEESKQESRYLPHYIFIIDCPKLVINHSVMEHLQSHETVLGVSLIYTTNIKANLPENLKTVFRLDGGGKGTLIMNEGTLVFREIDLYNISKERLSLTARRLTPIKHIQGVSTQIPESITFFEMYGVEKPEEIPVRALWNQNASQKSLAVPLGARGKDDYVYLNLHERAHGPHGLVAGTTGSGKSEIVQSYILSLAVNFHPHEVGFLLIDYKGGGMANLFKDLPHLLGTITNLDGSESMRALASIKSELKRRQQIFTGNGVNSINEYTKLFKKAEATEPLPHLFIISDEFAELKKEQPEFMKELVSAARIGRSLGVHLILATQKPAGVVDDQIWSNSKFKLALKVQNESDSNEILKTPDAARITQPGRAYLQVGNNEIYELFQSAFSGAPYSEEIAQKGFDNRVYAINRMGQGELLNEDLSETGEADAKLSQLDAVVRHVKQIYDSLKAKELKKELKKEVKKPWLAPLPDKIVNPHITTAIDVGLITEYNLSVPLGLVDLPDLQAQMEYFHDFAANGNLAVFGASGYSKSVTLMNIALSMAAANSPKLLNFYILDYGNSALVPLKALPHTADYLTFDDVEKLEKLINMLTELIKRRKQLFAGTNAMNFKMYNEIAKELGDPEVPQVPALIIMIDNYSVIKETGDETEKSLARLTRDGAGVGIYTVIAASRVSGILYSVLNNFKDKIAYHLNDAAEITTVIARGDYKLPAIRGRAYVSLNGTNIMQGYLPAPYESDMAYIKAIGETVKAISAQNSAGKAKGIPVLPEVLSYRDLEPYIKPDTKQALIGLSTETTAPVYMDLTAPVNLIGGTPQTGKTNVLKIILAQYQESLCYIFDGRAGELCEFSRRENVFYAADDFETVITGINDEVEMRAEKYEEAKKSNITNKEFVNKLPPCLIIIDDYESFLAATKAKPPTDVFTKAMYLGFSVIAAGRSIGFDGLAKVFKDRAVRGVVLGKPGEQQMLSSVTQPGYKQRDDIGLYVAGKNVTTIKLPFIKPTGPEI